MKHASACLVALRAPQPGRHISRDSSHPTAVSSSPIRCHFVTFTPQHEGGISISKHQHFPFRKQSLKTWRRSNPNSAQRGQISPTPTHFQLWAWMDEMQYLPLATKFILYSNFQLQVELSRVR